MRKQPSRGACVAGLVLALVAGSRAARAGEADAPAPSGEVEAPDGEVDVPAPSAEVEAPGAPGEVYAPVPSAQVYAPAKPEQPQTTWYGWQTLLADGAAAGLVGLAILSPDGNGANVLGTASFVTYLVGGPIIHWAHGHGAKGWGSLGLRVGLPLAGTLAGFLVGKAVYYAWSLVIPLVFIPMPWWQILLGYLAMHLTAGLILGVVFQLAHLVEGLSFPKPDADGAIAEGWVEKRGRSTCFCRVEVRSASDVLVATASVVYKVSSRTIPVPR